MAFVSKPRTLSKSRFVMGLQCPQKLIYASDSHTYCNRNNENSFLKSLAEGGFQVGELAKAHFPGGHDITTLNQEQALAQTNDLPSEKTCACHGFIGLLEAATFGGKVDVGNGAAVASELAGMVAANTRCHVTVVGVVGVVCPNFYIAGGWVGKTWKFRLGRFHQRLKSCTNHAGEIAHPFGLIKRVSRRLVAP